MFCEFVIRIKPTKYFFR